MIRLTDEQWERIRDHFPEEAIADGKPSGWLYCQRCEQIDGVMIKVGPDDGQRGNTRGAVLGRSAGSSDAVHGYYGHKAKSEEAS
jgi:hypothetical protein